MRRRNRRKLGARTYINYTQEMLNLAVDLVKNKIITSLEAEKQFLIPRRTIENKVKGLHMKTPGAQLRLGVSEEKDIVDVLIAAADFGSPLSRLDLRILIFNYLDKNNRSCLFSGNIPGKWWVRNFLSRNKDALTERAVQNIKKARAEKTVEEFENYFSNLERTVLDVPPQNILNYDETNLSDNPGSTKCIFKRKVKYPERIINHSKGNISIMFAASADGSLLPVYTVYKSEHLWSAWCVGGPPEARFNRTKSGWFDASVFEDWFKNVVIPWAAKLEGPKVVIGDNLSSHLNVGILRLCGEHDIRFAFLPPNSTHITQPLDVAFFGPLKKIWRRILTDYKIKNPSEAQINKAHFPILLTELLVEIRTCNKDNIKSGFKATGIFPFNPQKVLRKLPDYEEEIKYKIDTALLDFLKKTKAPAPIKRTVANKKLKVEPGCSISSQDAEKLMSGPKTRQQIENKKSNKPKSSETKVKILSEVRLTPENQAYLDLKQFSSYGLTTVNAQAKLPLKKKATENMNPYENPVPSTSGTCKVVKRKTPKRNQTKKRKVDYNSDAGNEDNYSLRDTSEEETFMSEDEDMALLSILTHNRNDKTDYNISEIWPDINNLEFCLEVETEKEEIQEFDINKIEMCENKETGLREENNVHSKIDETNIENKKIDNNKKKQGTLLDMDETEINEKINKYVNPDLDYIKTKQNENVNEQRYEERVIVDMNEIGKNENTDNKGVNSNIDQINIIEKTHEQDNNGMDINFDKEDEMKTKENETSEQDINCMDMKFDIEDEIETNENKTNEELANLNMDKIIQNEKVDFNTDQIYTKKKTDNEGVNSLHSNEDFDLSEIEKVKIKKTDEFKKEQSVKDAGNLDLGKNTDNKHEGKEGVISENEKSIYVKQSVLVRYYIRNNWKYYVGFIEKVDVQQMETYYSINFLKTVKKPTLRFLVCKRDRDVVPSSSIVKTVKLHTVKENREYLVEECDEHYF